MVQYTDTLTDTVTTTEGLLTRQTGVLSDGVRSRATPAITPLVNLADTVNVSESLVRYWAWGRVCEEIIAILDDAAAAARYSVVLSRILRIAEAQQLAYPRALTDTINVSQAQTVVRGLRIIEALGLGDAVAPITRRIVSLLDGVRITDGLYRFFSGEAVDGVVFSEAVSRGMRLRQTLTDGSAITDTLAKHFVVRLTAAETIDINDIDVLKLIYRPVLTDEVEITAGYISPNGNFTAWAINTRTAAVTEYTNFAFNSFAQMGRKYLAASDSGLYELNGDTDDTANIIAQLKSGFAQFAGSRFTTFKAAYLGMRGEGDFVLKLETGDGKTYNYAVSAKSMQTTRVHMGKGLRARYFSFELISTGQDFDLDSVEFMPLVVQRRV